MKKKLTVQKKTGIMSTAITLIVVLCLIVVNVIASAFTEKYPVKIDLTSNKAFELSEDSIKYISDLDKDITITVMNTRDSFARGGEYYEQAITVVEQYAKYNDNITLEFIDLMANPTYASEHADLSISVNDILVACGENTQKLTAYDLFNIQQSWYGGSITSSNAEQAMTGAIMNVTSEEKTKVTFLTGHEENENINLEDLLEKNNFEVNSIMLQAEAIPEDTEILIAIAPLRDYTEEDLEWIRLLMNLRDIDMPISNIKEYIQLYLQGDKTIDERRDLMCRYTEYIKKKIENTINNLEMAIRKLKQYDSAVADILDDKDLFEFNKK